MIDKIKSNIVLVVIGVIFVAFLIFISYPYFMQIQNLEKVNISINGKKISVEMADTYEKQVRGLMFHEPLKEDEGMLFVYGKEGYYGIWMPNMSFAIDILWIDKNSNIIHIERNVQPCESMPCKSYRAVKPSLYVLEMKANSSLDIKVGDKVDMSSMHVHQT